MTDFRDIQIGHYYTNRLNGELVNVHTINHVYDSDTQAFIGTFIRYYVLSGERMNEPLKAKENYFIENFSYYNP